ncbi:hypothetical protein EVAR_95250_1 [Eumeta japonica]|uniref:Uncharacterized protein n=1 Tax=Eumeta variegata TaxID=151549 RepID=A0A4C1UK89_EUMVA|nr:hypothetical protein EVAR_95250_1 [Eumeta japonica]
MVLFALSKLPRISLRIDRKNNSYHFEEQFVLPRPRLPLPRPPNPTVLKLTMPTQPRTSEGSSPGSTPSSPTTSVSGPGPRRWRRDDRMQRRLNTELLEAIEGRDDEEVERLVFK